MSQARPPQSNLRSANPAEAIVDALVLAARGSEITQSFLLSALPRVSELSSDAKATAQLHAQFRNVDGHVLIEGNVTGVLQMPCQRCLQPAKIAIDDAFNVMVVNAEADLDKLASEQDAIVADAARINLSWLAEEQLLLAVPLVPLHAADECGMTSALAPSEEQESAETQFAETQFAETRAAETQRPFANLHELMKNR